MSEPGPWPRPLTRAEVVADVVVPTRDHVHLTALNRFGLDFCRAADPQSEVAEKLVSYAETD